LEHLESPTVDRLERSDSSETDHPKSMETDHAASSGMTHQKSQEREHRESLTFPYSGKSFVGQFQAPVCECAQSQRILSKGHRKFPELRAAKSFLEPLASNLSRQSVTLRLQFPREKRSQNPVRELQEPEWKLNGKLANVVVSVEGALEKLVDDDFLRS
jgi:hypothetical protein